MVTANNGIQLQDDEAKETLSAIRSLPAHPEAKQALGDLKNNGYKMIALTNGSNATLAEQLDTSGLARFFDEQLSVEAIGKYKPDNRVYQWAAKKKQGFSQANV